MLETGTGDREHRKVERHTSHMLCHPVGIRVDLGVLGAASAMSEDGGRKGDVEEDACAHGVYEGRLYV